MDDQSRVWHVRMPGFSQATLKVPDLASPVLHWLDDEEADLNDYLADPVEPVIKLSYRESMWGARIYSELLATLYAFRETDLRDEDAFGR